MAGHMPKKKALVSTGNSALTIVHALLSDPEANYQDPGAICYEQRVHTAAKPQWRQEPRAPGYKVTIQAITPTPGELMAARLNHPP